MCVVPTSLPKERVVDALAAEFAALDELLTSLAPEQWSLPTACPGWDVQANVAHVIGTESMLAGIDAPAVTVDRDARPHVRNDIGGFNEAWVVGLAEASPAEVLERFRSITAGRLEALRAMDQAAWDAEGFTPAGTDTYGRFMRIRIFDCWMHEQDIRAAVGQPGHDAGPAVELSLDEITASMGFVVGKRAGAPEGSSVTFELLGDGGRTFHVLVAGRGALVEELPGPATVTLRVPVVAFTRLAGGRDDADPSAVEVVGDAELGARVVEHLGYTI